MCYEESYNNVSNNFRPDCTSVQTGCGVQVCVTPQKNDRFTSKFLAALCYSLRQTSKADFSRILERAVKKRIYYPQCFMVLFLKIYC